MRVYELEERIAGQSPNFHMVGRPCPNAKLYLGGGANKKTKIRDLPEGTYEHTKTHEKVKLQQVADGTYIHTQNGKCFALNPRDTEKYKLCPKQNYHPFNEWGRNAMPYI